MGVGTGDGGEEVGSGGGLGIQGSVVARGGYKRCVRGVTYGEVLGCISINKVNGEYVKGLRISYLRGC